MAPDLLRSTKALAGTILPPAGAPPDRVSIAISPSTTVAPRASAGERIMDTVVRELNEAFRGGTMDLHLKMGQVIINRLYAGDLSAWRAHGPKEVSFESLAARTGRDLLVSASSLYRAVALFELTERLGVSKWKSLGVSHLRAVLGLADQQQRPLLAAAEQGEWTVERLETEVSKLRGSENRRRGRPPLPAFMKTVHRIAKALARPARNLGGLDQIDGLSHTEIVRLHGLVAQAREQLQLVETRLASALRNKNTGRTRDDVGTERGRA